MSDMRSELEALARESFICSDDLDAILAKYPPAPVVTAGELWEAHLPTVAPYHVEPGAKYDANAVGRGRAYEAGFRAGVDALRAANLTVADEERP